MSREIPLSELAEHDGRDDGKDGVWTSIDGVVYDISEWRKTHPGGAVIRLAAGRESATLIESYHLEGSTGKVLAALQNKCTVVGKLRGAPPKADAKFFHAVRSRVDAHLKSKGFGRTTELLSMSELFVTLALYLIATYYIALYGSVWAAVALGILTGRLGFIMHSGNHCAMSSNPTLNAIGGVMMDLIGSTHILWSFEHQVAHHMDPNVLEKDNDCEIGNPYLRFHPEIKRRWWHKYNHIVTLVGMSVGFFKWYLTDPFCYLSRTVGNVKFAISNGDWARLWAWKAVWFVMHVAAPWYFMGFGRMFLCLMVFMVLGAYYLESIFIVNHIQDELVPPAMSHWADKQVLSTANWGSGSHLWNFVSGGLNHQIEHHLFPTYSIFLYPYMSPIVQETCKEFGLPYQNFASFPSAWLAMVSYLKALGTDKYDHFQPKTL